MSGDRDGAAIWADAVRAAALFAVDPAGLGGIVLRALPGPVRDRWLSLLQAMLPASAPVRRVPLHIGDGRLLGGLDLAATLQAGRPVAERGLLAESDGGVVLLAMAERTSPGTAARLAGVLDTGEVLVERDGLARRFPARLGIVALDEGSDGDERLASALRDRLAFHLDLSAVSLRDSEAGAPSRAAIAAARLRLAGVTVPGEVDEALCATALALGIGSLRGSLLAVRAARASAALGGRSEVDADDATEAGRLVLAPRATCLPAAEEVPEEPEPEPPPEQQAESDTPPDLDDVVLAAVQAAIPPDLLARLRLAELAASRASGAGRAGAQKQGTGRGRPAGVRRGEPRAGKRLSVVETLRAAAPWQPLRRRSRKTGEGPRVEVRKDDFRIRHHKQRSRTTTIFVVDASGSSAFHRLAEAKGAVELLLAECYVRRDSVALITFRGAGANLLLPPTRSLTRAKRGLADLPGGGATPLAAGLDAGLALADAVRRRGETPVMVLLTDGDANIARDGTRGRAAAEPDLMATARRLRGASLTALLVDTSPRPRPQARNLAAAMGALYLPLPHADPAALSRAVQAAAAAGGSGRASAA